MLDFLETVGGVDVPEGAVVSQNAFAQRYGSLRASKQSAAQPRFQAPGIANHSREGDDLGFDAFASAHPDQGQDELEIGATRLVGNHLDFVHDDSARLRQDMGICQRQGRELLVGEERDVILAADERRHVVRFAGRLEDPKAEPAIDPFKMTALVGDESLQREKKD